MLPSHENLELGLWMKNLDAAVGDVFDQMLSVVCTPVKEIPRLETPIKVALDVTGDVQGQCFLYFNPVGANAAMQALAGNEIDESMIEDALGEIGNMIFGTVKRKVDCYFLTSSISVPSVSRDSLDFERFDVIDGSRRAYAFLDHILVIELHLCAKSIAYGTPALP